jgi:hypothetical protein
MLKKTKKKISYVIIFLLVLSCSSPLEQQEIKFKFFDRSKLHISMLDFCDIKTKNEYMKISNRPNDSIVLFFEGFKQGTDFIISTDRREYFKTITKHPLIHQRYLDYIVISKTELSSGLPLSMSLKYHLPEYEEYSYHYKIIIDSLDKNVLTSKSIVVRLDKGEGIDDYVTLGFSDVNEVTFEKIKKRCADSMHKN